MTANPIPAAAVRSRLLATKLFIPSAHPELVSRPRLVARLVEGMSRRLTLVSAPPGSGKTTLLVEWRQSPLGRDVPLAWLTVDERENDSNRFMSYLVAALERVIPEAGEGIWSLLHSNSPVDFEYLMTQLINNVGAMPTTFALVIDDYHAITNPAIHAGIDFLLMNMPQQMHLFVTSRSDPPLALSRLRGRGDLVEIRAADLRFSREEIAAFLNDVAGLGIEPADVQTLEERTEGWAAGIQLAALSMRGRDDTHAFIEAFSGGNRFIVDYLLEEVLSRQPEDIQDFLLRTSILDRMTADLCCTIVGRDDCQEIIESLEQANLFIIALDNERQWYRYHSLFADLLRQRLQQLVSDDEVAALHARASDWYEEQNIVTEAVLHARLAGDQERAADLIESVADRMLNRGLLETLINWLTTMPDEVRCCRPKLSAFCIWSMLSSGRVDEIPRYIQEIEDFVARPDCVHWSTGEPITDADREVLRGVIAASKAAIAVQERRFLDTIELSNTALKLVPEDMPIARSITLYSRGFAQALTGDVRSAAGSFSDAIAISHQHGSSPFLMFNRTALGQNRIAEGRIREAEQINRESIAYAKERGIQAWPYMGFVHICLGRTFYERGALDEAMAEVETGLKLARNWNTIAFQLEGYYNRATIQIARGDFAGASETIDLAHQLVPITSKNPQLERVQGFRALIDVHTGNPGPAVAWAEPYAVAMATEDFDLETFWAWIPVDRIATSVLSAGGHPDVARDLLERLLEVAVENGWGMYALQLRASLARAYWLLGECDTALTVFDTALVSAAPEGIAGPFIDALPESSLLLQAWLRQNPQINEASGFLATLNEVLGTVEETTVQPVSGKSDRNLTLPEPLSDRELEVLQLIVAGKSNAEIAEQLYVAVGTVKTHAHNIYGKLDVRTRTQAVARARELDLIAD